MNMNVNLDNHNPKLFPDSQQEAEQQVLNMSQADQEGEEDQPAESSVPTQMSDCPPEVMPGTCCMPVHAGQAVRFVLCSYSWSAMHLW